MRERQVWGPASPDDPPVIRVLPVRRYRCAECGQTCTVGPREVIPGRYYSQSAIGLAMVLYSLEGCSQAVSYVRTRLELAGCDREIFTTDALTLLHEATRGAMRNIDRIATICLDLAARSTRRLVERDLLLRVIEHDSQEIIS